MKYRKFGKLDWMISELSIGVLRLEEVVSDGVLDEENRIAAIRYAIDQGVNYINLGYPYYFADINKSCAYVKKALADGYRERVKVAVNISSRNAEDQKNLETALNNQLELFSLEYADFCIIDWVDRSTWLKLKELDIASWALRTISSGKAHHIGLTFHDDAYYLKGINEVYKDWAVIQMELSILDYKHHPGVGGFKFTQEYGNAVIATDFTKAGRLLNNIPETVKTLWDQVKTKRTIEAWCLRWVLGFEEVSSVLINFESVNQVKDYLSYAVEVNAGDVDVLETLQATKIREAYYAKKYISCTACRCCMPCGLGIDAPRIVELYNDAVVFGDDRIPKFIYNLENNNLVECVQCAQCMNQCPKHFPLMEILEDARNRFAGD